MAISAEFQADFSQFTAAVKEATGGLATMEGQAQIVDAAISSLALQASNGIKALASDIIATAGTFVASYAEEEAATRRLVSALEAQGTASAEVTGAYADMATQFQTTTKYSDDAITSAQAVLTTIGKIGPEQMLPAATAAANLATTLNIDLNKAATIVAKAVASGGEELGKLAGVMGDVDLKGKSAAQMLELMNAQMGPAAVNQAKTFGGQQAILANQIDDVTGKMGGLITEALTPMLNLFTSLPGPLQQVIVGAGLLGTALAPIAVSIGALTPAILALAGALGITLVGALSTLAALLLPGALLVAGIILVYKTFKNWDRIVEICAAVYEGIKTYLVDRFNALVSAILAPINAVAGGFKSLYDKVVGHSYVPDMIQGISDNFGKLDSAMVQPTKTAVSAVLSSFNEAARAAQALITDTGGVSRNAFGQVVATSGGLIGMAKTMGQQAGGQFGAVNITINGSVLSNKNEIARVVGDAVTSSYRQGGNRLG